MIAIIGLPIFFVLVSAVVERIRSEYARPFNMNDDEDGRRRRFIFMRRKVIGDLTSIYIDRFILLKTPLFTIMLHQIFRPDGQRDLHDHPWNFFSIILRGSYVEDTGSGIRECRWFNFKRKTDRHSIRKVRRAPTWTLVFTGRRTRVWGFWVKLPLQEGQERVAFAFVPYYNYDKLNNA